ncbi:MAG: poly-gamma-glutamate synthase PgsB [Candidatus Marinimicrobia bacterium]|nr:poly-gamma-glutamate synthase PgsB [Candidatus Neomarinimicrobiota bacterium]MBT3945010.1 poly-gamma-glutamate synthase PgsB [Candidatus Neomarinimicrobiota bacterium]MBT4155005.1 poly-gamma-glutamate synthase PgsB [Candidatus Neomarinimicrobiota bacterium]MBT4752332.1 poly-gamma-glutamate synthase PgsB [Candidatus Neomarinimicrobiota bacterium]MBT5114905.1 poly-gamma-glutamate synthase PgsB [Candidatus Neomarinimicrobiota bacterium]|tara:strand:- start:3591 stop:4772 length:1182 start_codon:yes stop_codon:yes gene_type:complete
MSLTPLIVLGFLAIAICISGILEYQFHMRSLVAIPLRIHVNGTRGKSSVTRLVAAGLREAGIRTFAKTTGTAPRVIDAEGKDRIIHRLRLPSIGEQTRLLSYFASEKPEAVVMECMAVQPQYQWIAEHQMVQSQIGVITNVRPDHLDEMGPTEDDVAYSLCNTVPDNGILITGEDQKPEILRQVAKINGTEFIQSNEADISRDELDQFTYMEHPANVAVALDVCKKAGVDRHIALAGMHKVQPDLGALIAWNLDQGEKRIQFINGMAANDPVSTLQIWKFIIDRYPAEGGTCVFFNSRDDRPFRTRQLIELTLEEIKPDYFIIRGDKIDAIVQRLIHYSPGTNVQIIGLSNDHNQVIDKLLSLPHDTLIYAIGNQVGAGQEILTKLSDYRHHG